MDACASLQAALAGRDLVLQIEARLPQLSPIMRSIGGYCVRTHAWLHLVSIDEVASQCGTVPSSVVRFARLFGHRGFHDLKVAFLNGASTTVGAGPGDKAVARARLLSSLDEDVFQLSELRVLLEEDAFLIAVDWIRAQAKLSLGFHGELDRMVAMHLGDALQRAGKFVLLADQLQIRAPHPLQAGITCINLDLERPRLHLDRSMDIDACVDCGGCLIDLPGVVRERPAQVSVRRFTLPVSGSTLGRRLQKALSIADTIAAALH